MSIAPPPQANPLRDDIRLANVPSPCAVVIFGVTGDLAGRKLVPALYNLHVRRLLPAGLVVLGVGRSDVGGDDGLRTMLRAETEEHSRTPVTDDAWNAFAAVARLRPGQLRRRRDLRRA